MKFRNQVFLICFMILGGFLAPLFAAESGLEASDQKRLRELEQAVTQSKEDVLRTKARIHELEEAVLRGKITGSKALISFENEAEGFFSLTEAEFYIDDELAQKIVVEGRRKPLFKTTILDRDLPPGEHVIRTKLFFRGADKSIFTMFPYFKDHKFELDSVDKFLVEYGKTTQVRLTVLDKGYFKTDLKERLFLQVNAATDWGTGTQE